MSDPFPHGSNSRNDSTISFHQQQQAQTQSNDLDAWHEYTTGDDVYSHVPIDPNLCMEMMESRLDGNSPPFEYSTTVAITDHNPDTDGAFDMDME